MHAVVTADCNSSVNIRNDCGMKTEISEQRVCMNENVALRLPFAERSHQNHNYLPASADYGEDSTVSENAHSI